MSGFTPRNFTVFWGIGVVYSKNPLEKQAGKGFFAVESDEFEWL